MKLNFYHVYPSPITHESRMMKQVRSLKESGLAENVYIIGTQEGALAAREEIASGVYIVRLNSPRFHSRAARILSWSLGVVWFLIRQNPDVIHAHSLSALPFCFFVSLLRNSVLIYDCHELETETVRSKGLRKFLAKLTERLLIRWPAVVFVVSPSIADWYRTHYNNLSVFLVRNVPEISHWEASGASKSDILRRKLKVEDQSLVFIYQGILTRERNIDQLIESFKSIADKTKHLVLIGMGPLAKWAEEVSKKHSNIHFVPALPTQELANWTQGADVGISFIEGSCLNYKFCLPNKIFEYTAAGLPTIVSPTVELSNFIQKYQCGWICDSTSEKFKTLVSALDRKQIETRKPNVELIGRENNWSIDSQVYIQAIRRALDSGRGLRGVRHFKP